MSSGETQLRHPLTLGLGLPAVVLVTTFACLAADRLIDVAFVVSCLLPLAAGVVALRRTRGGGAFLPLLLCAQLLGLVMTVDRLVHGGSATLIAPAAGIAAVTCYLLSVLALLRSRRPSEYRDAMFDGFAVLTATLVLAWQWAALQPGASAVDIASTVIPVVGALNGVTVLAILFGVLRDPRQTRRIPLSLAGFAVLLIIASAGTDSYTRPDAPWWAAAARLLASLWLAAVLLHPNLGRMLELEPSRRRLLEMRWLGPACALVATPLLMLIFFVYDAVPSVEVGVACCVLTGVAMWRGSRLLRDREQSRRALLAEQRFRALVEHATDAILILDPAGRVTYAGGAVDTLLGKRKLVGRTLRDLLAADDVSTVQRTLDSLRRKGASSPVGRDILLRSRTGGGSWVSVTATNHLKTPEIEGWVLNVHDITDRKKAEESLFRMALEDPLTGLPNRAGLRGALEDLISTSPGSAAVLFCDLDGFKAVNDLHGHESGDAVLRAVAGRWSALLRGDDLLGRWGGDEFLVVSTGVTDHTDATHIGNRLVAALADPVVLPAGDASLGVSIGLAVHQPGESLDTLLRRADAAMYAAKRAAGGLRTG